jgi:hypothetical protein
MVDRREESSRRGGIQEALRRVFDIDMGSRMAGRYSSGRRGATAAYASASLIGLLLVVRFFLDYTLDFVLYLAWHSAFHAVRSDIDVTFVFNGAPRRQLVSALLILLLESLLLFGITITVLWERGYGPSVMWVVHLGSPSFGGELDPQRSWVLLDYALAMVAADAAARTSCLVAKTAVAGIVSGVLAAVAIGPINLSSGKNNNCIQI